MPHYLLYCPMKSLIMNQTQINAVNYHSRCRHLGRSWSSDYICFRVTVLKFPEWIVVDSNALRVHVSCILPLKYANEQCRGKNKTDAFDATNFKVWTN